jgi:kynurenine formamidase
VKSVYFFRKTRSGFFVLPLKIKGIEGAPARAVLLDTMV